MRVLTWQFNGPYKGSFDHYMTIEDTDLDLMLWMTIINNNVTMTMPQSTLTPRRMPMIISSLFMSSNFSMMEFSSSPILIFPVQEKLIFVCKLARKRLIWFIAILWKKPVILNMLLSKVLIFLLLTVWLSSKKLRKMHQIHGCFVACCSIIKQHNGHWILNLAVRWIVQLHCSKKQLTWAKSACLACIQNPSLYLGAPSCLKQLDTKVGTLWSYKLMPRQQCYDLAKTLMQWYVVGVVRAPNFRASSRAFIVLSSRAFANS